MHMGRVLLSSVGSPALHYSSTLSHKGTIFGGGELMDIKCVLIYFTAFFPEIFLILRRIQRDTLTNVQRSLCKVPVILFRFQLNFNFLDRFSKNTEISNFTKIRQVEAELFPCGQTDRTADKHDEANSSLSQFFRRV